MKLLVFTALVVAALLTGTLHAQVPNVITYQGRVAVSGVNFDGSGSFKFALVNTNGSTTYWSNDGTSTAGSEPTAAVSLTVTKGLYSVLLGDTTLTNMTAIPASVFTNSDVRLRVWFNDGTHGFQLITPDSRVTAAGYAIMAGTVPDGSITAAKIASGTVTGTQLASGLTLAGTTSGTFSGNLSGNATSATSATTAGSFSGSLVGDVTGTQGATVVSAVGASSATNVRVAELLANAATSANTPGALVRRDASGSFSVAKLINSGTLTLPTSTDTLLGRATTDLLSNKTITDPTNTVTAVQLRTTGADVVLSAAAPPAAGQVLTASGATTASWQSIPKPKVDRQWAAGGTAFTSSAAYVDIMTFTTHDLGETGCYTITFNADSSGTTGNVSFILNINGVDISDTAYTFTNAARPVTITYVAHNVAAGSAIKVRFKSALQNFQVRADSCQFMIDGVPDSYVR